MPRGRKKKLVHEISNKYSVRVSHETMEKFERKMVQEGYSSKTKFIHKIIWNYIDEVRYFNERESIVDNYIVDKTKELLKYKTEEDANCVLSFRASKEMEAMIEVHISKKNNMAVNFNLKKIILEYINTKL